MIVIVDTDPNFHARVASEAGPDAISTDLAELERMISGGDELPGVVLLGPGVGLSEALGVAQGLQRTAPEVSVVLVTDVLTSGLLQSALRAGVRDVLPTSFSSEQIRDVLERAEQIGASVRGRGSELQPHRQDEPSGEACKIVTVFSAKGGVGKSFVASNLAVLMAHRHARVALVDLDLQFGDQAIMLQMFPARTLADASASLDRLDSEMLAQHLTLHRSGVHLLAAPLEPGLAETIQPVATQRILRLLRQSFDCVIIDTPPLFTEHVLAALDESDEVVFLTSLDVPSIKNTKLAMQTLEMLGVGQDRIRLLLNRADSQVGLRVQEVERMLGTRVGVQIPSNREVPLSINQGSPLAFSDPKSSVTAILRELADSIGRAIPAAPPGAKRGKFGFKRRVS